MSEDREQAESPAEQAGSPVEQAEATETQVLAAVERAAEASDEAPTATATSERPIIAQQTEVPSAGKIETAEEIFAAHPQRENESDAAVEVAVATDATATAETGNAVPVQAASGSIQAADLATDPNPAAGLSPERDGEIRISSDHPMAALYMQSPMPPEMRGNRGAGVLIALLGSVAFALVYAGVLALWLAPAYPPSTFLSDGLLPLVFSWGFVAAVLGFFLGFVLLVLIVGRAGWWAYVLGGLLVAVFTWAVTLGVSALVDRLGGETVSLHPLSMVADYGLLFSVLAAGLVAREVAVWFGAWIGARGRKMKRLNAEAIAEYETALAEAQAKQP